MVVLDTDVVVAAVLSPTGASRRLLLEVVDGTRPAAISVPLLLEYEAVLKRPGQLQASGLSAADVDIILDQLASAMTHVTMFYLWRPFLRDAKDDMVLETAVNGGAGAIATFNLGDYGDVPGRFGITVARPREILRRS